MITPVSKTCTDDDHTSKQRTDMGCWRGHTRARERPASCRCRVSRLLPLRLRRMSPSCCPARKLRTLPAAEGAAGNLYTSSSCRAECLNPRCLKDFHASLVVPCLSFFFYLSSILSREVSDAIGPSALVAAISLPMVQSADQKLF